jgi:hypothetical protein
MTATLVRAPSTSLTVTNARFVAGEIDGTEDTMCASGANAVTMLLVAPVTSAMLSWSVMPAVRVPF